MIYTYVYGERLVITIMNRKAYHKKYHIVNKERINAEKRIKYGVSVGKIEIGPCVECGKLLEENIPVFEDYSDTSKYQWVCKSCKANIDAAYENEINIIELRIKDNEYYRSFK